MTKKKAIILTVTLTPLIAGLYGILHDQLTYSISPEYFTKFKFVQFQITPDIPDRIGVTIVGFGATWWTGLIIGIVLSLTSLSYKDPNKMFKTLVKSVLLTLIITFVVGLIGLWIGSGINENFFYLPIELDDPKSFIMVGAMHNFSYIGGLIGLISAVIYIVKQKKSTLKLADT